MATDCENELVGIVIGMMDRMGVTKITFTDAELDIIEERCFNQSLVVEVDDVGIHASITSHTEPQKSVETFKTH